MSPHAAVEILHGRRLRGARGAALRDRLARRYAEESLTPQAALRCGAIDAVIDPAQTRATRHRSARPRRGARAALRALRRTVGRTPGPLVSGAASQARQSARPMPNGHRLTSAPEGAQP